MRNKTSVTSEQSNTLTPLSFAVRIEVGSPREDERGGWVCPVLITTVDDKVGSISGIDSMQALCLAMRFLEQPLRSAEERGSRLLETGEESDFPLDACFRGNRQRENERPAPQF